MEPRRIDVHQYGQKLKEQEELFETTKMLPENKQLVQEFIDFCKVDPKIGEGRIVKYYYMLRKIGTLSEKPFKEMDEKDVMSLLARMQDMKTVKGRNFSELTLMDLRKAICKFWRWLYFDQYRGDKPPMIRRVFTSVPKSRKEPEIYTKEEISKLINGMNGARDKAFFSCLYDLCCRVGELLSRQLCHVRCTGAGDIQILVEADKTKNSHWETLYESVPHFSAWLRSHPTPNDKSAPLWPVCKVDGNGRRYIEPVCYGTIKKVFTNAIKREGIRSGEKNILHMLRRSKASHDLVDGVGISYIESRGSWSKGSKALLECYISIQQKDKDNAYRKKYNLPISEHEAPEIRTCSRCFSILDNLQFCGRCGTPSSAKAASMQKFANEAAPSVITKKQLSQMVEQYVSQALTSGDPEIMEALRKLQING